ncbi:sensor histidine kinase [Cellulophaga sp. F20128]|uniref:ATP-binding protein n=1 Tax=Cellulophaga sp. F20128 TaxID=2926413 RepID=UPI001FF16438|nr:tetratricopeptide repeat protein [Cellulophaga sp. F20128]MCK0158226.1 sensor histidine kinase [Cellulophaga sp. F20128]
MKPIFALSCCLFFLFFKAHCKPIDSGTLYLAQQSISSDTTAIKAFYKTGASFLKIKDFENAYKNFNLGSQKAIEIKHAYFTSLGNYYLGDYFFQTKDITQALSFMNKALDSFLANDHQADVAKCSYKLGSIYKSISDFEKALSNAFRALKINEVLKEETEIARASTLIGAIYLITGDYKAAGLNFKRALRLQEKLHDETSLVLTYLNLGALNQKQKLFKEALAYFYEGLEKIENLSKKGEISLNLKDDQAILLGNIGSTLRAKEDYKGSLEFLFKALVIKEELKRNVSTAHTYNDIAETYIKMQEYGKAKKFALEGARLAKNESVNKERWAYFLISKCEYALENYQSSYDNLQTYTILKDSIFAVEKAARFNEMQIQYETEKQDYQIKAQEKDISLLDTQNRLKSQVLWFGGFGLLTVFGLILALKSRAKIRDNIKQKEQFTQGLIEAQESERTRVSKDLHDSVGQQLTFLKKKAQNLEQQELSELANAALEEVRSISRDLYPATLKQIGLTASIEQLLFDLDGETDMFFSVELEDINASFDEKETLNFYRFIQESVNNVLKHSYAKTLIVNILKRDKTIEVLIKDNGKGFPINKGILQNSLGLKTMAERIRILKGKLSIQSTRAIGTTILVKIPI